jgi:6-phosphogluconolactonase
MKTFAYIASFSAAGASPGIHMFRWNTRKPGLTPLGVHSDGLANPIYLASDGHKRLFAADCTRDPDKGGRVISMAVDLQTGGLHTINSVASAGLIPVYLATSQDGNNLLVANCGPYSRGTEGRTVAAFRIRSGGRLNEATTIQPHLECSIDPVRQSSSHPHCVAMAPDGGHVYVPDLGADRIYCYGYNSRFGALLREPANTTALPAGSGPRYIEFHPGGEYVYVNTEMGSCVHVYRRNAQGSLDELQVISADPGNQPDRNCADLKVHPTGKYLFVTNRARETLSTFAIDPDQGTLQPIGQVSTGGSFPRSLAITPNGRTILVGNEHGASVVGFSFDATYGQMKPLGVLAEMPGPACIALVTG